VVRNQELKMLKERNLVNGTERIKVLLERKIGAVFLIRKNVQGQIRSRVRAGSLRTRKTRKNEFVPAEIL